VSDAGRATPLIICHGAEDVGGSAVPKNTQKYLVDAGVKDLELHLYNMGHSTCDE